MCTWINAHTTSFPQVYETISNGLWVDPLAPDLQVYRAVTARKFLFAVFGCFPNFLHTSSPYQAPSSIIKHYKASSSIIKHYRASPSIIKHYKASSNIIKHHQALSSVTKHHQALSSVTKHQQAPITDGY
eukprot:GHVT01032420.1.p1 GENE.GHVT01032420.1~~GHVT01032420.1.p1  ORF type:complete len:130 (+),score=5.53 GHVT01032420.1:853-1242(+)